jgi:uncharacterized protein YfiM (DUF2279 family)
MKTLLTTLLLFATISAHAQQRYLNEPMLHYSYSALITTTAIGYLHYQGVEKQKAAKYGVLIGLGAGILKESLDNRWSNEDLANNFVGVASAAIVFNLPIKKRDKRHATLQH